VRGGVEASPHRAAIQLTTDNPVFGGLGGASVASEGISWGKESPAGRNVMVFADFTIGLPLLCQGLLDHYGPGHVRSARRHIAGSVAALLDDPDPAGRPR
jgi:deoxyhypusine synthase